MMPFKVANVAVPAAFAVAGIAILLALLGPTL